MAEAPARPLPAGLPDGLRALRLLGESPTSEVWLVEDAAHAPFALKILRPSVARDERVRERWQREAELLAELDHPNLVRCHDAFEVGDRPALLLDYVEGPTLREVLRDGPLGWEQAARYGVQIARALGKLHRHGAVHRDVKPHNVLIHARRGAVLADLGLVRRDEDPTLTRQGTALGSPAYMSPEQARDPSDVDAQADVYSLGATLHHALTGRPPFLGAGVGEVIHRLMHDEPEPLPEEVPDALRRVLSTALAKDRERRYARAEDFGSDLGRVLLGYAPRLLTRRRRRLRIRTAWTGGGMAAAALLAFLFWPPAQPSGAEESAAIAAQEPTAGAAAQPAAAQPRDEQSLPPPDPESGLRAFEQWSQPFALRMRAALDGGRWRDARAEIDGVRASRIPEAAPVGFMPAKLAWLQTATEELQAAVERAAGRALEILEQETALAREAIALGAFAAEDWEATVMDQWRGAGLRLDGLPLWPGGSDPVGRLKMTRLALERQSEQERLRAALTALPGLRARAAELLRTGDFLAARRLWEDAAPTLFEHAREARFELARTDELLALQRRLEARLRERAGQIVNLSLRDSGRLEGTVIADAAGYAVDYRGQSRIPVDLLLLDAEFALDWLGGQPNPWLTAHLEWCQGREARAADRMEQLDSDGLPAEWAPAFWSVEWRREVLAAAAVGETGPSDPPPAPPAADAEGVQSAHGALLDALRRRFPGAALTLRGDAVEIGFAAVSLEPEWSVDLRSELRAWRLTRWEIAWRVGIGQDPPQQLRWLEGVEMRAPVGKLPEIVLDSRAHPGFGILAGQGVQTLLWDNGEVSLDGVRIGECQAPRRGILSAESSAPFMLTAVRLSLVPR